MPLPIDFSAHNAEVAQVWDAYYKGQPTRVPMIIGLSSRFTILSRDANPLGINYEQYFTDPDIMFQHQLHHQHYIRHNIISDTEMGLPDAWGMYVDFQNSYEALWWGADLRFIDGDVPDTPYLVRDHNKWDFIDRGIPDPFGGWLGRAWEYREHFIQKAQDFEFCGRPVTVGGVPGAGTDGPFTTACALRGPTELCIDMYEDPEFFHAFMDLLVTGTIERMKAYRQRFGEQPESKAWGWADDSILLCSDRTYRELILPHHRKLNDAFGSEGPNSIHLCGDATHLFKTIRDEMNVTAFDTGFPVDHGWLRRELGPDIAINGGPHVEVLRTSTPDAIRAETRRILQSGIMEGGKFILREGNNLAPGTPPENVLAMYEACKEFGRYH